MPQLTLDPADVGAIQGPPLARPIDPAIRRFGRLPNFEDWRVGDVILFAPVHADLIARVIRRSQLRGGYSEEDARWIHAGIYIGEHYMLEANLPKVRFGPIYARIPKYLIRVRRPVLARDPAAGLGYRLAISALTRMGEYYSLKDVLRSWGMCRRGLWKSPLPKERLPGLFCSQLYTTAYQAVHSQLLISHNGFAPVSYTLPADLSATPALEDVQLHWVKI